MVKRAGMKRSKKTGLPAGSLIHVGKAGEDVHINVIDYDEKTLEETEVKTVEECIPFKDKKTVTWINVCGLSQTDVLERLGKVFGLHPLVMEDILNTEQRPKMEDFGDYVYIVLRMLRRDGGQDKISAEQVSLILGSNFVISFQETEGDVFDPIRERIRSGKGRLRAAGTDHLAYALIDIIVDNYFVILETLGEKIETLEENLMARPTPKTLHELYGLKRSMIFLRKSVWPLREVVSGLQRTDSPLIEATTGIYLRDVYDHTIQVIDTIETFRDMLSGLLDIYLSSISNRMNEVMKILTVISTIFIPLTFITGIYGMNFRYLPELEWHWGYPAVLAIMFVIVVCMLIFFRRKRWL